MQNNTEGSVLQASSKGKDREKEQNNDEKNHDKHRHSRDKERGSRDRGNEGVICSADVRA
jgi:hypothetical protein